MSTVNILMPNGEYPGQYIKGNVATDYNPELGEMLTYGVYIKSSSDEAVYKMNNGIDLYIDGSKLEYDANGVLDNGAISSLKLIAHSSGNIMDTVTGLAWEGENFKATVNAGDSYYTESIILEGNDKINGSSGDDELWGNAGNDKLKGGAGDDDLSGGRGKDTYDGGGGSNDQLNYSDTYWDTVGAQGVTVNMATGKATDPWGNSETFSHIERIKGTQFVDHLVGSKGNDQFRPLGGKDIVDGGSGSDTVRYDRDGRYEGGAHGVSVDLSAGFGIDGFGDKDSLKRIENVIGTDFADKLSGSSAVNTLKGGGGNDSLKGGTGGDNLFGQSGSDKLYGGDGNDEFVYEHLSDSTVGSNGRDTIFDLEAGDKIDLSAVDADKVAPGNQRFTFVGTSSFTGAPGELRYNKQASDTYIYADVNGDKKSDFEIHLDSSMSLAKSFFHL